MMKKISKNTIALAEQEFNQGKLLTLLDAELTAYDLIYNTKVLNVLRSRKKDMTGLKLPGEKCWMPVRRLLWITTRS